MTHDNSIKSYRDLPPDSVLEVAREIIRLQCAGYEPTANVIGRMIGKPASSVTGRIGDIRHPEKGNGCVVVDGVLYRLFEAMTLAEFQKITTRAERQRQEAEKQTTLFK